MGEVFVDRGPECVVVGIPSGIYLAATAEIAKRAARCGCALRGEHWTGRRKRGEGASRAVEAIRNEGLVNVLQNLEVCALHAHISHLHTKRRAELALNRKVPVLSISVVEIRINRKGAQTDARTCGERILQGYCIC